MPNPYVNKVVQSNGTTLIDISDTTAVAADVASGKYFYLATGEKVVGTASGGGGYDIPTFTITFDSSYSTVLSVTCDKTYANCLSIFNSGNNTAMSLITAQGTSDEFYGGVTVTATGTGVITYTGYNVAHPAFDIVYNSNGTMSYVEPSAFVDTLNVTVNGTYYADGDKDWTEVNVNVSGGTPSATQHTILFEFEDTTSASITAYYDSAFITNAITATIPTTYDSKTVQQASLDGVAWYTKPSEDWDVLYDSTVEFHSNTPYNQIWLSALGDLQPAVGEIYRVTIDGTVYNITAHEDEGVVYVGNPMYDWGNDDGSGVPFCLFNSYGSWHGWTELSAAEHTVKIEKQVTT